MDARPITFLSDYGHEDEFAGVCRAVIMRIAPEARVIDISHGIRPRDVAAGAAALAAALPYAPPGVHLAIVDPGVGTERRAVAVRAADDDRVLVGPDNGLMAPAIEGFGGALEAVDLAQSPFRLEPVSATFHGRDVFAPVAAQLALGARLSEAGESIGPENLYSPPRPEARVERDRAVVHAIRVDRFGNVSLDLAEGELADHSLGAVERVAITAPAGRRKAAWGQTFADVPPGELVLYEDSSGGLAIAVNHGSAAEALGVQAGDELSLRAERT